MEWYVDWFDTKYYHILYKNRDWNEAKVFIKNLVEFLEPKKNSYFLDLACGKGRHSKELNSLGYKVLGVDLSENSIQSAKQFENDSLSFKTGDMRKVNFPNQFDYIFNLFTSFGYFDSTEENFSVFDAVYSQLKPKGTFVFDYLNPNHAKNQFKEYEEKTIDGITFKLSKILTDTFVKKQIEFRVENQDFNYQESVRLFQPKLIKEELVKRGFTINSMFGDYQLNDYTEDSPRILIIANRN